jgi:LPXTG-motif cell wall-anchored protein
VRHGRHAARKARRFALVLIAAGALVIAALATIAGAVVTPAPGNVTITATGATFTIFIQGSPITVGPFSGSFKGTVDATGKLKFPKAGIKFTPFSQTIQIPVTITVAASTDFAGTIDPDSSTLSLSGSLVTLASAQTPALNNCPIGPAKVNLQSKNYSKTTGKATVSDPAFVIPAIPAGTAGCVDDTVIQTINDTLTLPSTGGVTGPVTVSPVLTGNGTPPPSTTTFTTTTSTSTTTVPATTAPNTVAPSALPRTGSSTGPLAFIGLALLAGGLALAFRRRRSPLET